MSRVKPKPFNNYPPSLLPPRPFPRFPRPSQLDWQNIVLGDCRRNSSRSSLTQSIARADLRSVIIDPPVQPNSTRDIVPVHPGLSTALGLGSSSGIAPPYSQTRIYQTTSHSELASSLIPATRPRSELEAEATAAFLSTNDVEHARARKRPRIDHFSTVNAQASTSTLRTPTTSTRPHYDSHNNAMRLPESDQDSAFSVSLDSVPEAGPSSAGAGPSSNGHANGNGFTIAAPSTPPPHSPVTMNGSSGNGFGNGIQKHSRSIARVTLPGTTLYDDSCTDREEFVRLVIQSLRDVGYIESAATLEAESGYSLEAPEVAHFRDHVLEGQWADAEEALMQLCVTTEDEIWEARFLISQQKYLELLEARKTNPALQVLRNELTPLSVDPDQLHSLSSLIMCTEPEDLRQRADWDGAYGTSRHRLLTNLQRYIPSSVMIPQRRFDALLHQARSYQIQHCVYHTSPTSSAFSLYRDHQCSKAAFPRVTTTILEVHTDEVWNLEWSHDGRYLASASKDKSAIIWRIGPESEPSIREYAPELILRDHAFPVGCLAWSLDDSVLLTSAEHFIKLWNAKTGVCIRVLEAHTETVTALAWIPDGSGFISGALDRKIILWDNDGKQRETWPVSLVRVTDLALSPDLSRLVAIGMQFEQPPSSAMELSQQSQQAGDAPPQPAAGSCAASPSGSRNSEFRMIVYDWTTKHIESSIRMEGDLTSLKISQDSQYALINHAPDEIHLWDLHAERLARKFTGQRQGKHVIRSCFGGIDDNFIVSGSEDSYVYVWHRDTGTLLEVLPGHGSGSVNSVAWNPRNQRMFASCGDDRSIRIWEAPPPEAMYLPPPAVELNGKGKAKVRQPRWDGDGSNGEGGGGCWSPPDLN